MFLTVSNPSKLSVVLFFVEKKERKKATGKRYTARFPDTP